MLTQKHLDHLPIFPLPKVSLFPDTVLPLHVFEPRYRALTRYCLDNEWPLAVPMLSDEPQPETSLPLVLPIAGAGTIRQHQELPDGRYGILLQGNARVRILSEVATDLPYRIVRAEVVHDTDTRSSQCSEDMQTITDCLSLLRVRIPNLVDALTSLNGETNPGELTNRLASILFRDAQQRQSILSEASVEKRLRLVRDRVAALAARTASADDPVN